MANRRQSNFALEEENLLLLLVQKFKHIIECKKSGNTNWIEKKNAWQNIENEFNSKNTRNIFRNAEGLKEKYNNLKKKTKKKITEEKMNIRKTGGGSYNPLTLNETDQIIYEIIGPQIDGLKNNYDDDAGLCGVILDNSETISQGKSKLGI